MQSPCALCCLGNTHTRPTSAVRRRVARSGCRRTGGFVSAFGIPFPTRRKSASSSSMTHPRKLPAHRLRRPPPFFAPVPLRSRRDGWTVERQCGFLARLYVSGSVRAAARAVGMSRASAYRLRGRAGAEGFAHAWDHVLTPPGQGRSGSGGTLPMGDLRKVTLAELVGRVERSLVRPVLWRGKIVTIAEKGDNSALLHLLERNVTRAARRLQARSASDPRVRENTAFGVNETPGIPPSVGLRRGDEGNASRSAFRRPCAGRGRSRPRPCAAYAPGGGGHGRASPSRSPSPDGPLPARG